MLRSMRLARTFALHKKVWARCNDHTFLFVIKIVEKQQQEPEQPPVLKNSALSLVRRIWRRVENIAFSVVFAFIVLYFVLQTPFVQNWIIGKVTDYLSKELQTTVQIDHIDIALFDNLVLDGFYVADQKGDTLLYARELRAGLNNNIFSLFNNKLEFNEIRLNRATVNLRRRVGEFDNNAQFILDYFSTDTPKSGKPSALQFKVKNLWLTNVQFLSDDAVRGQMMLFKLPSANIRIDRFDLLSRLAEIRSVSVDGFSFLLREYEGHPLPEGKAPEVKTISASIDTAFAAPPLRMIVERFNLSNGRFNLDQSARGYPRIEADSVMDFHNMEVSGIQIQAEHVYMNDDLFFSGHLKHLAAKERCGFTLLHAEAKDVVVCDSITALYDTKIQTSGTELGDTITLQYRSYRDFLKFNDRVKMDARFTEGSHVQLNDIMYFDPSLNRNTFFVRNRGETAQLQGHIYGKINSLNGRDLTLKLGQRTLIKGDFDGDDMGEGADRIRLAFDFKTLRSDMATIRAIIPGFNAPAIFNKLGHINYEGRYQVLFGYNHILDGHIVTDVGSGDLDMELDLTGGAAKATYSGQLNMTAFDLASWTGDSNFGKTTFHLNIADGSSGLTLPTIKAKITGAIDSLTYKGYRYRNLTMNGNFNKYVFNGHFGIEDPNINFVFDGTANFQDTLPILDLQADIKRLDLGALNLVQKDWVISGKIPMINLQMHNLDDLAGEANFRDIELVENKKTVHHIGILQFKSGYNTKGERQFILNSDIISGTAEGRFNPLTLGDHIQYLLSRQHPLFAQQLGLLRNDTLALKDQVRFTVNFRDTKEWLHLIDPKMDSLVDVSILGNIETGKGMLNLELNAPSVGYAGVTFRRLDFGWLSRDNQVSFHLDVPETRVGERDPLEPIAFSGEGSKDG
ncbi:MAG: hypothetical protein IPL65_02940 [Lewinellaceae bacterium]|nr:hypothetical protein [Lewinellaceae bacterium]